MELVSFDIVSFPQTVTFIHSNFHFREPSLLLSYKYKSSLGGIRFEVCEYDLCSRCIVCRLQFSEAITHAVYIRDRGPEDANIVVAFSSGTFELWSSVTGKVCHSFSPISKSDFRSCVAFEYSLVLHSVIFSRSEGPLEIFALPGMTDGAHVQKEYTDLKFQDLGRPLCMAPSVIRDYVAVGYHSGILAIWTSKAKVSDKAHLPSITLDADSAVKVQTTPAPLVAVASFSGALTSVAFNDDEKTIVCGNSSGVVFLWQIDYDTSSAILIEVKKPFVKPVT